MNWEKIQEKYPKAFSYLKETSHYDVKETRRLYDFFDKNDIFIEISIDKVDRWFYDIFGCYDSGNIFKIAENSKYLIRSNAETAAFEKAFEILEQKL